MSVKQARELAVHVTVERGRWVALVGSPAL